MSHTGNAYTAPNVTPERAAVLAPYRMSYPAAAPTDAHWTDRVITQGHVDCCAAYGHATLTTNGEVSPRCPRCGEVTATPTPEPEHTAPATGDPVTTPDGPGIMAGVTGHLYAVTYPHGIPAVGLAAGSTLGYAPADVNPRAPRTYTARRIAARFYEYTGEDEHTPGEHFNVDATPHTVDHDAQTFDTMAELVAAVRRDYVTFDATGADWAADPDGSRDIDYATGEREAVSWHFDTISPAMLHRVIIPAVNARP